MSFNLEDARVGDLLVCYLAYLNSPKAEAKVEELLGKFIVVSKSSSEANNNKNGDNDVLTLYMLYRNFRWSPSSDKVGSIITMDVEYMKGCFFSYKVAYRPEGKEVVQSGLSWDDHEPNENVGISTIMEDSL